MFRSKRARFLAESGDVTSAVYSTAVTLTFTGLNPVWRRSRAAARMANLVFEKESMFEIDVFVSQRGRAMGGGHPRLTVTEIFDRAHQFRSPVES